MMRRGTVQAGPRHRQPSLTLRPTRDPFLGESPGPCIRVSGGALGGRTARRDRAIAVGLDATDGRITLEAFRLIGERRFVGYCLGGVYPHVEVPALARDALAGRLELAPLIPER